MKDLLRNWIQVLIFIVTVAVSYGSLSEKVNTVANALETHIDAHDDYIRQREWEMVITELRALRRDINTLFQQKADKGAK